MAATTVVVATGCPRDDADRPRIQLPRQDTPSVVQIQRFPLGVQAGAMTAHSVILWAYSTHVGGHTFAIWPVDQAPEFSAHTAEVTSNDGYLKLRVEGLESATWYHYGIFTDEGDWSPLGRCRTADGLDDKRPILVGASACTAAGRAPFPSLSFLAKQPLDVFCHLGDMSYNDGAQTRAEFRAAWSKTLAVPDYQALLRSVGTYQTWDDHEITDNDEMSNLSSDARIQGIDAYFETTPTDRSNDGRLWTSYRWGQSVEFFILDCRQERTPSRGEYVSVAQMTWLKSALSSSPCHFKVILNSVPIAQLPDVWLMEDDRWQGYPRQRDELLNFIVDTPIDNVWFLAGDFHIGAVWRVESSGPRQQIWEILCGPGGSKPSRRYTLASTDPEIYDTFFPPEQVRYASGSWAATTVLFDPIQDEVTVRFFNAENEELLHESILRSS